MSPSAKSRIETSPEFLGQTLRLRRKIFRSPLATTEDGGVLLDLEHDRLLKLNPTGVQFWNALATSKTEDEIIRDIAGEHGVDPDLVKQDLRSFLDRISELNLTPAAQAADAVRTLITEPAIQTPNFPWYASKRLKKTSRRDPLSTFAALMGLLAFDCVLSLFSIKTLCAIVHRWPVRDSSRKDRAALTERVCMAAERACVWYPKKALCLQRSAITTCMLRLGGMPAELVIGAQPMPFQAHAWVELRGSVVNDHRGVAKIYRVLARY